LSSEEFLNSNDQLQKPSSKVFPSLIVFFFLTLTSVVGYTPEIWKLGMNSLFHMVRVGLGKQHLFFEGGAAQHKATEQR
jgi:hypothetical protein